MMKACMKFGVKEDLLKFMLRFGVVEKPEFIMNNPNKDLNIFKT